MLRWLTLEHFYRVCYSKYTEGFVHSYTVEYVGYDADLSGLIWIINQPLRRWKQE